MSLELAKKQFYEKIKEYPEFTLDRQGAIINLIELASKTDWKYPEKNEFPESERIILAYSKSKKIVKPIFYSIDEGTRLWLKLNFEAWCELPNFDKA